MKKDKLPYILVGFVAGVIAATLLVGGYYRKNLYTSYSNWAKINVILNEVEKNYVDTIDRKAATDAAIEAALRCLDPHSVYMQPEPLKEADESLAGGFEGIGIQFNVPNDTAVVLSVILGGPSEKAGILSGDRIIKVDDRTIAGTKTPRDTMVHLMKGPKGTKVRVTVGRGGELIPFDLVRDKIPEKSVDAAFMVNDTTGYLRLSGYLAACGEEQEFLGFAASLGIKPSSEQEWEQSREYMLPQIYGLCGRYSKVGKTAYYRYVLPGDTVVQAVLK